MRSEAHQGETNELAPVLPRREDTILLQRAHIDTLKARVAQLQEQHHDAAGRRASDSYEISNLSAALDSHKAEAVRRQVEISKHGDAYFRVALEGVLRGTLVPGRDRLVCGELLAAGADAAIVEELARANKGTKHAGEIDVECFIDALSNATKYQTADQAADMLRDYTRVAVCILDNRYRIKLEKAASPAGFLSSFVCTD